MAQYFEDWKDRSEGDLPDGLDNGEVVIFEDGGVLTMPLGEAATALLPASEDVEVLVLVLWDAPYFTYARWFVDLVGSKTSYYVRVQGSANPPSTGLWLEKDGVFRESVSALPDSQGEWTWFRLRKQDNQLRAKLWLDGQTEPDTWALSRPTTVLDEQVASVGFLGGSSFYVKQIGVGTGGDPAPVGPIEDEEPVIVETASAAATASAKAVHVVRAARDVHLSAAGAAAVSHHVSAAKGTPSAKSRRLGSAQAMASGRAVSAVRSARYVAAGPAEAEALSHGVRVTGVARDVRLAAAGAAAVSHAVVAARGIPDAKSRRLGSAQVTASGRAVSVARAARDVNLPDAVATATAHPVRVVMGAAVRRLGTAQMHATGLVVSVTPAGKDASIGPAKAEALSNTVHVARASRDVRLVASGAAAVSHLVSVAPGATKAESRRLGTAKAAALSYAVPLARPVHRFDGSTSTYAPGGTTRTTRFPGCTSTHSISKNSRTFA